MIDHWPIRADTPANLKDGVPVLEPPPKTWKAVTENGLKAEWSFL